MFKRSLAVIALAFVSLAASAAVVQPIGVHYQVLIPAAGSVPGQNGTYFRSDITIANLLNRAQTVRVEWLSQNGTANMSRELQMPAGTGIRSADFVVEYLNTSGLGSIVLTALTGPGSSVVDTTAKLYVASRIWSPQPGTGGTTSQSFDVIPVSAVNMPLGVFYAVGGGPAPDDASKYRFNIGIVNLDPVNAQTYAIYIPVPTIPIPVSVTVPPRSMVQIGMGSGTSPTTEYFIQNITGTATRSNTWTAYRSTVNDITGDAWSELALPNAPE
jgi:hypothetical protein